MKKIILVSLISIAVISCKKVNLDSLAFPSVELENYSFNSYDDPEVIIDASYFIDASQTHLIPLQSIDSETGEVFTIYGIYLGDTSTIATDSIIMYFHGQSRHNDFYFTRQELLANVGGKNNYGVFMIDYRGYGMSEGSSTEHGLYDDANAAIDWLKLNGANPNRTFYYGYSLGAIPAIDRTAYREDFKPAKLIIEAPLASVQYLTQSSTVINVDSKFVANLEFENAEKMKLVSCPLMWLHGMEDTYVKIENGEIIYENHTGSYKEAHRVEGSDHSEIIDHLGVANYLKLVRDFIIL